MSWNLIEFKGKVSEVVGIPYADATFKGLLALVSEKGTDDARLEDVAKVVSQTFKSEIESGKLSRERFKETVKKLYFLI